MTEMLELDDGSLVLMSSVQRLEPRRKDRDGDWVRGVIGLDGELMGLARARDVEELTGALVPATDGWQIASYSRPRDKEFHVRSQPLVAWRINGEGCTPITIEQCEGPYLIVAPDGTVRAPYDGIPVSLSLYYGGMWGSLDEATAAKRAAWEAKRAEWESERATLDAAREAIRAWNAAE